MPFVIGTEDEKEKKCSLESLVSFCLSHRNFLHEKLLESGAILFRGFIVTTPADFEKVVRAFSGKDLLNYTGGASPRVELGGGVYTSTEYPAQYTISLHNELSYAHKYPSRVYFCCIKPSKTGGETPIADSRRILKNIDPEIVKQFKAKKIRYDRNLFSDAGSGYSWQDAFETFDKTIVENYCREADIKFEWKDGGRLRLSQTLPATAIHPITGEEVWFNQADGFHPSALDPENYESLITTIPEEEFRLNVFYGDGTAIDIAELENIREVIKNETVIFPWQTGDILILDNLLTAHGRMAFEGERKIILAMT